MQLAPVRDQNIITVPLPKYVAILLGHSTHQRNNRMTTEFREHIIKVAKESSEKYKIRIRQARAKAIKQVKDISHVSKDETQRVEKLVQVLTEKHCSEIDNLVKSKSAEILGAKTR